MSTSSRSETELCGSRLRELLAYDPCSGAFRWRVKRNGTAGVNAIAGWACADGYVRIKVNYNIYRAHRLAWLYEYGEWPAEYIDHINGDRDDNRIANLRLANQSENGANRRRGIKNTSGLKGVCWSRWAKKWQAQITVRGQRKYLGYFDDPQSAHDAYVAAATERFGQYARAS